MATEHRPSSTELRPPAEPRLDIRTEIVAAAQRLIQERGVKGATTRAIAEEAGCAEGSIYRYFPDKHALFIECIGSRFPEFLALLASLPDRAGKGSVRKNLEEVAVAALGFYRAILPMVAGAMADRALLEGQRLHWEERQGGPMRAIRSVASYLWEERRRGRVWERTSPEHAARLLLGACFSQASLEALLGEDSRIGADEQFARDVVRTLLDGLDPRKVPSPLR